MVLSDGIGQAALQHVTAAPSNDRRQAVFQAVPVSAGRTTHEHVANAGNLLQKGGGLSQIEPSPRPCGPVPTCKSGTRIKLLEKWPGS